MEHSKAVTNEDDDILLPNSSIQHEIDLSESGIDMLPDDYFSKHNLSSDPELVHNISLSGNQLIELPTTITIFSNLISVSVCNNRLVNFPEDFGSLRHLRFLDARNNLLENLPKSFAMLNKLQTINLSGNRFTHIPDVLFQLQTVRALHLGGNRIETVPNAIGTLLSLDVLYLGGNRLTEIPATIGRLLNLTVLSLCGNQLETIPATIADLQSLRTLVLHSNLLTTLPTEIVRLRNLQHLSLRNNPLVNQFVRDMSFEPPTLKELSARTVKMKIAESTFTTVLPQVLTEYIASANQCVNPKCKGVYFDACVEHVKFVDFCGKYRVPLLQYLCSPRCSSSTPAYAHSDSSDSEGFDEWPSTSDYKLRKVMLG
ncbi:Leucine-rich repeat-containing protein 58 [Toxocara canis]|uniref:Leucine-rich repeat-containing protein 58 n=2 Tax=Toxocara canis TaxID=6265 RepID=A0A0B2VCW2_TOXCA|nr:Leucine-rich repeat-containing protein 58 [Toxocara canis]